MSNTKSLLALIWPEYKKPLISYMMKNFSGPKGAMFRDVKKIIAWGIESGLPDSTIFYNVKCYLFQNGTVNRSGNRSVDRAGTIEHLLQGKRIDHYLDYGCGDGSITKSVADKLGVRRAYGTDVLDSIPSKGITYIKVDELKILPSGSFDLITCMVSLHHIQDLPGAIETISRLLRADGALIIREHDCPALGATDADEPNLPVFLNLIHLWNDSSYSDITYRTKKEWIELFANYGFEVVSESTYDGNNPQKLFYLYLKKETV